MTNAMRNDVRSQCDCNATDGRTNERRSTHAVVGHLPAVTRARPYGEITSIGDVIAAGIKPTGQRHDLNRTGERAEIPPAVRTAVWWRDRGRCELCGWQRVNGPWHLDHITPWSAGGSDHTDNLRVLCEHHNLARSNYIDPTERPRRPATWWCLNCLSEPWLRLRNAHTGQIEPICPIHAWSRACNVRRALTWFAENDAEDWWTRDPIDERHKLTVAHCAHCGTPGLTDQPL